MFSYGCENIVALATAPGRGALAIVRFSGPDLNSTYRDFSHKGPIDRRAVYSKIYHPKNNKLLDEGVITYYKSPPSAYSITICKCSVSTKLVWYLIILRCLIFFKIDASFKASF